MDRELVLAVLAALLGGVALTLAGWWPAGAPDLSGGRAGERKAWRRLWLPFVPALFTLAALAGWALNVMNMRGVVKKRIGKKAA